MIELTLKVRHTCDVCKGTIRELEWDRMSERDIRNFEITPSFGSYTLTVGGGFDTIMVCEPCYKPIMERIKEMRWKHGT